MRTYRYTADELSKSIIIPLGYTDESHATKLYLDAAVWLDDCPGGTLQLLVRNPNGDLYAAPTTSENGVLVWELTGGDTAYSGAGEIELNLRGTSGECIKSARCSTWIDASLTGEAGSQPEEVQSWITNLLNAAAEASGAAGMIDNMTVEANALPAGSEATAELTEVSGHYHLKLGLPRGNTGEQGATGETGPQGPQGPIGETPRISVQVATGAAGSEAQVSVGGTAEAPIIYLTIPRGDPGRDGTGAGTVTAVKVAGETHAPDDTGVVDLGQITGGADLSDAAPAALGTAAAGASGLAARADHVHPMPTAAQVGAATAESVSQLKNDIDGLSDAIANAGGVKTVAGVGPDSAGNVALTAADVGALATSGTAADSSKLGGKTLAEIMLTLYPVGAVYISANSTSPASLFGGTWEQIHGRFLLASGSPNANTDNLFGAIIGGWSANSGSTGGQDYHTLTVDELPSHTHESQYVKPEAGYAAAGMMGSTEANWWSSDYIRATGGGQKHNNMPPYLAVNMWKRVS